MNGDAASGRVSFRYITGEVPMALDLDRRTSVARSGRRQAARSGSAEASVIRIDLRDFIFDKRSFGTCRRIRARNGGMTLNRFTMRHPAFTPRAREG